MATFRDRFAETITEEDIERTRRDRLAHLAQERARMEMANRLGIDAEYLGTLQDQANNQIQSQMPNQSELTIDPIELTIPRQQQPRYQSGFDGQMIRQGTVVPPQTNTTGLSLLGENATSLANDIVNRRRNRISNQPQASMPTSSANNPVMTGILQALSGNTGMVTGSPSGYLPEMIRAQSQQPQIDREAGVDYRSGSPDGYISAMENASMNPTRFSGLLGQPGVEQRQISGARRDVVDMSNPIPIDPVRPDVQYIEENQNIDQYALGQEESKLGLKPGGGTGLKSDLIDYAKDGSGAVLYNGQNTGLTADELNEAQQRLSGNYGSQDHYQKTFGNKEFLLAVALGLNSLSTFPNQQWGKFLEGQMQSIQKRKGAIDGANWLLSKGRRDLAEAVATGALDFDKAYAEFTKKPEETFRELTAEEYKAMGHDPLTSGRIQVSETTGKLSGFGSKAPVTNINVGDKVSDEMGKLLVEGDVEVYRNAPKAARRVSDLNNTADAIIRGAVSEGKEGFETGPFAEFRKSVDSFLVGFGNRDEKVVNRLNDAQLIDATLGADVFGAIGELGIGARGLDTPNEREFLRQVLTGTTQTTPAALLYMTYLRQKIQKGIIDTYNEYLDSGVYGKYKESRNMQKVQSPPTIFVDEKGKPKEFNSFKEMQEWLADQKAQYSESTTTQGVGTVTKDGIEYEIEEVQ